MNSKILFSQKDKRLNKMIIKLNFNNQWQKSQKNKVNNVLKILLIKLKKNWNKNKIIKIWNKIKLDNNPKYFWLINKYHKNKQLHLIKN